MHIRILLDYKELSRATANMIVDYVSRKPDALICLASGHTPLGVFECLVDDVRQKKIDFSNCSFVGLDEWVGIGPTQDGSCRLMMDQSFFQPLQIPLSRIHFFDALSTNLQAEADRINAVIAANNGLDIMLVGVGTNGHIAMNEPGTPFTSVAHISELAEETKAVGQKYFQQATPLSKGITLGLQHFRDARLPIVIANGIKKATIIKKAIWSKGGEHLPASIVQKIPESYVMLDQEAALELGR